MTSSPTPGPPTTTTPVMGGRGRPVKVAGVAGAICSALMVASTSFVLNAAGLYPLEQLAVLGFVIVTVFLPGWFIADAWPVSRRLDRFTRLGLAFVCGLGPHLFGWALAVRLHQHLLLYLPPALVVLAGLGYRTFAKRRRARAADDKAAAYTTALAAGFEKPEPRSTPLAIATPVIVLLAWLLLLRSGWDTLWGVYAPRHPGNWYPDLYWHSSLTAEAMRHAPVQDPQSVIEGMLSYHWFTNAHAAAIVMATGANLHAVTLVAALVPAAFATVALVYGLTRYLASSTLGGAVATLLLMLPLNVVTLPGLNLGGAKSWMWLSPSHMFALPLVVALTWLCVYLLRQTWHGAAHRQHLWSAWLLLAYLALLAPGSKVSLLPTLLGGAGLVFLGALIRRRGWRPPLLMGICGTAIVAGTMPLFAGGGGGSKLVFGASVLQLQMVRREYLEPVSGAAQVWVVLALCVVLLATYAPVILAFSNRRLMKDPALIFFAGTAMAALLAVLGLQHPSMSQVYFVLGIAPIITAFATAGVVHLVRGWALGSTWRGWLVIGDAIAGCLIGGWVLQNERVTDLDPGAGLFIQAAVLLVIMVGLVVLFLTGKARGLAVVLSVFILGYALAPSSLNFEQLYRPPGKSKPSDWTLYSVEVAGARKLAAANPSGQLVATNVHCVPRQHLSHCDNRAFWVSAIAESPVLIGGWGYSASARADDGKGGLPYTEQPYFRPKLFKTNQDAFLHPTEENLAALRHHGVRFLFADERLTPVSPKLATMTDVVWSRDGVQVLRLR